MQKETMGRRSALRQAINRYRDAYCADSWKGGGDPDDYEAIEQELVAADTALGALIERYLA